MRRAAKRIKLVGRASTPAAGLQARLFGSSRTRSSASGGRSGGDRPQAWRTGPEAYPTRIFRISALGSSTIRLLTSNSMVARCSARIGWPVRIARAGERQPCAAHLAGERPRLRAGAHEYARFVYDYLGGLRIGRACMLLVETDRPISVIASEAGFPNLSNFSPRFREAAPHDAEGFPALCCETRPDAGLTTEGRPDQAVSVVGNADEAAELNAPARCA